MFLSLTSSFSLKSIHIFKKKEELNGDNRPQEGN